MKTANTPRTTLCQSAVATAQSEFNAKTQRRKGAKLNKIKPEPAHWTTCSRRATTPKTNLSLFQTLCAFASLRLCVKSPRLRFGLVTLCLALFVTLPDHANAQVRFINGRPVGMPDMSGGMPSGMDSPPSSSKSDAGGKDAGGPWLPSEVASTSMTSTNADGAKTNIVEDIQLSFQGANIDMIVQWLAQQTGKTVVKHPRVQCQLTITSSKKVSPRQAIVLVYRALALEGFTAIESSQSIMIVPEGSATGVTRVARSRPSKSAASRPSAATSSSCRAASTSSNTPCV